MDLKQWEMGEAARKGDVNGAGLWRNEYRAQETRWRESILAIAAADHAVDDADVLLVLRPGEIVTHEIRTASDYVWYR